MAWAAQLERVYREASPRLVGFLQRQYRVPREAAEDLAQETFLKMMRYPEYFHGTVAEATMFWFGKQLALNHLRNLKHPAAACVERAEELRPDVAVVEAAPLARVQLAELCKRLQPAHWNALLLYAEGASYHEIAALFRLSLSATKAMLHRARRRARAIAGGTV